MVWKLCSSLLQAIILDFSSGIPDMASEGDVSNPRISKASGARLCRKCVLWLCSMSQIEFS